MFLIKNLKNVQNRPQNIYTEKSFTNEIKNTLYSTLVNILTILPLGDKDFSKDKKTRINKIL